jgi:hypothetical protein
MKKSIILTFLLVATITVCQNQRASASKKIANPKALTISLIRLNLKLSQPKPVLQFVGAAFDPLDSTIVYDMYGSSGSLTSVIVFKNGVQQSSSGISISGNYHPGGANLFIVTGSITRGGSSFSVNGTYDIS